MTNIRWKRAIIVGASSGIGEQIAMQLAAGGCQVALVARRGEELRRLAKQINARAERVAATCHPHDITCTSAVPALFQEIVAEMGGLDIIVHAAGIMPSVGPDEYDTAKDLDVVAVNVSGAIAWLNQAAHRFTCEGGGTIVGIGSVSGDRGRRGSPVYGASKAFLDTYLESLRNRLGRYGVSVVTIKPGPVATPMTAGLGKLPLMISAEEAATQIIAAAVDRAGTVYVPAKWKPIMGVIRAIPSPVFRMLKI
ncbi:MAG: SDR family NAD(P)-dependent oxidoreductase [Capsulimonadaceae bacterium]